MSAILGHEAALLLPVELQLFSEPNDEPQLDQRDRRSHHVQRKRCFGRQQWFEVT